MNVVVIGANGATGRNVVAACRARGHAVTAFVRGEAPDGVRVVRGDATAPADVARAVEGQDAVVVALGIRENPLWVRLRGSRGTRMDVRSVGTHNVVAAMRAHGVRRLVVQSTYGAGETWSGLSVPWKLAFSLVLAPQLADTERQEAVVRDSGLEWLLVRPVSLTDAPDAPVAIGPTARSMRVPRVAVARVMVDLLEAPEVQRAVAVSG